jgi:hypothetical protein
MKCLKCGFESTEDFKYCANCGEAVEDETSSETSPEINPVSERFITIFQDKLFIAICILMTISCAFGIFSGSLNVINILITIFLWLTYSKARSGVVSVEHLRCVSGSVYANYIIANVVSGILIVCGFIVSLAGGLLAMSGEYLDEIIDEIELSIPKYLQIQEEMYTIIGVAIGIGFIFVAAILLLVNLLGQRKIHRFAKSVYQAIYTGNPYFENPNAVKNWLMFFGVCSAISAVTSISEIETVISMGCIAAAEIIASVMVKRYFVFNPVDNNN